MRCLLLSALLFVTLPAAAKTIVVSTADAQCSSPADCTHGLRFARGDWLLVCSNTGDCTAVGYHAGITGQTERLPVSVLIRRKAGATSPATTLVTVDRRCAKTCCSTANRCKPARCSRCCAPIRPAPSCTNTATNNGRSPPAALPKCWPRWMPTKAAAARPAPC